MATDIAWPLRALYNRSSTFVYGTSKLDPLEHLLTLLRPEVVGWRVLEAHNAWTLRFVPQPNVVVFGQAILGDCDVILDDGREFQVSAGDFLLMASPPPWALRALGGAPEVDFKDVMADPTLLTAHGEPQAVTRFIAGHFKFAAEGAELLGKLLLPIVHIRSEADSGRLSALLDLIGDEALVERPGGSLVVKRLLEVLLVEALRHPGVGWNQENSGLLEGLSDPRIGQALRLMHDDIGRVRTVDDLARSAGMSRSAFAERFTAVVGLPPTSYAASWRMTLAKQALASGDGSMLEIAELAGYRSVSAFSTAFRKLTGASPTRFARSRSAAHV